MLTALIGLVVAGIAAVVVLTLLFTVFSVVFGLLGLVVALAFKVLPLVLVGYVIVKLVQRGERSGLCRSRLSASDRAWLDT